MSRVIAASVLATTIVGAAFIACGSSSSPKQVDAKVFMDGKVFMDAPGSGSGSATGVGEPCTAGSGGGISQGSCPAGYVCLSGLSGAHGMWCSKTCVQGSGDQCNVGYTGPDVAACIFRITVTSGSGSGSGSAMDYCGIICEGSAIGCPSTTCNGTCPGTLTCSAPLQNSSGSDVGSACF